MSLFPRITLALIAAFFPTLIYTLLIWWLDRYEREPVRLMVVAFVWGAIPAVVLSILLELLLGQPVLPFGPALWQDVLPGTLFAPIIEETAKGMALLLLFLVVRDTFDSVLDGIVYGAVIGFGFAMTENFLYYLESLGSGSWQDWRAVILLRSLLFGFNHAFYTAIIGAGFGLAAVVRTDRRWVNWLFPLLGWALAMAFHAVHNLGLTLSQSSSAALLVALTADLGGVIVLMAIALLAWQQERRWIATELIPEVGYTITPEEYDAACSYARRLSLWLDIFRSDGLAAARRSSRQYHLLAKLAFLKQRRRRQGDSPQLSRQIVAVRAELRAARA